MSINKSQFNVKLDIDIVRAVDARLIDKITGRRQYGATSALISNLLKQWLQEQDRKDGNTGDTGNPNGSPTTVD